MPRLLFILAVIAFFSAAPAPAQDAVRPFGTPDPTAWPPKSAAEPKSSTAAGDLGLTAEDAALFRLHWRSVALHFAQIGDAFHCAPAFNPKFPSSTALDADAWQQQNATHERRVAGTLVRDVQLLPPREEAVAATMLLPALAVGQYGHIHSALVSQVVGEQEMVVTELWLLDAREIAEQKKDDELTGERLFRIAVEDANRANQQQQRTNSAGSSANTRPRNVQPAITMDQIRKELEQRYRQRNKAIDTQNTWKAHRIRLLGFPTAGLQPGQRWTYQGGLGPQLVIVADPAQQGLNAAPAKSILATRAVNPTLTAINGELFKQPWKEDRFARLLEERGLDAPAFVSMLRDQFRATPADVVTGVLGQLEKVKADRLAAQLKAAKEAELEAARLKAAQDAAARKAATSKTNPGSAPPATGEKKPSFMELKYGDRLKKAREQSPTPTPPCFP
jgi:hypothetical protein